MKKLFTLICFLIGSSTYAQEIHVTDVINRIELGELVGNRDLSFGVKNVLEELVQDYGYDLNPESENLLTVELLYFDVMKSSLQLGAYGKNIDVYQVIARGTLVLDGKSRTELAKGTAKSISTATLIIDEGGKFSQANVSTAIKKLCDDLLKKLKL
jgi:uncharacterized lipoprotein YajG